MKLLPMAAARVMVGCIPRLERPPFGGHGGHGGGGGVTPSGSSDGASVSEKVVPAKQEPSTLIAFDGTRCVVTANRFRETVIGEKVWCAWAATR